MLMFWMLILSEQKRVKAVLYTYTSYPITHLQVAGCSTVVQWCLAVVIFAVKKCVATSL